MTREGTTRRRFLRGTGGAVVGGALLYGTSRPTRAQSGEAWPQFGYDDANTGHAPSNTGPVAGITEQWRFETGDLVDSSPAVADGTVYVGSDDNNVYALGRGNRKVGSAGIVIPGGLHLWPWQLGLGLGILAVPTILAVATSLSVKEDKKPETSIRPGIDPSSRPDIEPSPDSGLDERVNESLQEGDNLREEASDYRDAGEYDRALNTYEKAQDEYEDALETANKSNLIDTDEIEQKLAAVEEARQEIHYQQLQDEVESLRSDLDHADTLADEGNFEEARKRLADVDSRFESATETAIDRSFEDIRDEIAKLEQRRDGLRDEIATLEKRDQLTEKIATLRSELNDTESLVDEAEFEEAQERLETLQPRLSTTIETATQHGFNDLRDEIISLEQRRKDRLEEVTERLQARPIPDEIPRAPNVDVDYDVLTDEEPIGRGGNADVTKATLPTPDGPVTLAIKKPRMSGTLHTDQVQRLLEEAETWDKIDDHDHIVGVVDYDSEPIPWIAMEYMDGGHLGERIGEMDIPQALWTAIAITKGVRHAHRRAAIAHLDLKPENILFRTIDDAWDAPKVGDWGLSKHLINHSKSVEGKTFDYAAPEQFDADKFGPADDLTDVYQLGAVFYELFTGQPPFEGTPTEVMRAVMDDEPAPPSEIADVPDALDDILLTALAKQKDQRYEDILLLRNDLQDLYDEL